MELNLNGYRVLLLPRPLGQNYVHADLATGSKGNHDNVHADPSVNRPFLSSARRPCFRLTSGVSGLEAHWRGEWLSGGSSGGSRGAAGVPEDAQSGFSRQVSGCCVRVPLPPFPFFFSSFFLLLFLPPAQLPSSCSLPFTFIIVAFLPLPRRCCQKA